MSTNNSNNKINDFFTKNKKVIITSSVVVLAVAAAAGGYLASINNKVKSWEDKIYPGVQAYGVDLSGKTKEEAVQILNDELAVFTDLEDLSMVQAFVTQTPYIIDKLYAYRTSLENELLTYLGLDNNLDDPTKDRLLVDQVNANNNLINANQYGFKKNIEAFIDHIREVLGYEITMEFVYKPVDSVYDNKEGGPDNDLQ